MDADFPAMMRGLAVAEAVVATLLGAMAGSFANVAIYRLPRQESLVAPRSRCPHCGHLIRARDNVPVLSFLWLRGRCRDCGGAISWRYPLVETLTAALFLAAWWWFGLSVQALGAAIFVLIMVIVIFVDLEHRIIPNAVTYPGVVVGLLLAAAGGPGSFLGSLLSAVGAFLLFLLIAVVSRGGMGGGDIKLAAVMGAFLGWPVVAAALFLSFTTGGIVGLALLASGRRKRKDPVPFGPFLATGGLLALFWGEALVEWYLKWPLRGI
jgi:leader peptidase (prepilin peptidase)/N-methyltransferase